MKISDKDMEDLKEAKVILAKFCGKYYKYKDFDEQVELLFNAKWLVSEAIVMLEIRGKEKEARK